MRRFVQCAGLFQPLPPQIYPENVSQATMLSEEAMKVGFSGGLVVDYPHSTRAKKYYLCLMVGSAQGPPPALTGARTDEVAFAGRERGSKKRKTGDTKGKVRGACGVCCTARLVVKHSQHPPFRTSTPLNRPG